MSLIADGDERGMANNKHNSTVQPSTSNVSGNGSAVNPAMTPGFSSIESLLINVVGLIEVAAHTARFQDQQMKRESGESDNMNNR